MNQLVTPVGRLFYMLWKLARENYISLDTKNKIKDMTIQNDLKILELLEFIKGNQNEKRIEQMIMAFLDDQIMKFNSLQGADCDISEESQSIKSARTMPRFFSFKPKKIEIKQSNFRLVLNNSAHSQTPKVVPTNPKTKVCVGSKSKPLENLTRIRSNTSNKNDPINSTSDC